MMIPSNELTCRTLFYHAASDGRAQALFGPYWEKTCDAVLPYTQGVAFPNLYLEFPLKGDPFLDVTALIHTVEPGGPSCPEAVAGFAPVYNWVTKLHEADRRICFGFELDAATAASGPAAVHFQHYEKLHLAEEFCKRMGDRETVSGSGGTYASGMASLFFWYVPGTCRFLAAGLRIPVPEGNCPLRGESGLSGNSVQPDRFHSL